jgi:hypothetical protein
MMSAIRNTMSPRRPRRATIAAAAAAAVALLAGASPAAAGRTPPASTARWAQAMRQLRVPGKGCFTAAYPILQWRQTQCTTAPHRPFTPAPHRAYTPALGDRPQTVGGGGAGADYVAEVSGSLFNATGGFSGISPGATESEQEGPPPIPPVPNVFSLQLNSEPFKTTLCKPSPPIGSKCLGWEQFVYTTNPSLVFIQDWLLNYNLAVCPPDWTPFGTGCYMNSAAVPAPALTAQDLPTVTLTGTASLVNDQVVLTSLSGGATAVSANDTLGLSGHWTGVEWGVFGDGGGAEALFSPGTTLTADTVVNNGGAPWSCGFKGWTGETNNLTLAPDPVIAVPRFFSTQTNGPTSGPPGCATAAGAGGTHLKTFGNLLYSFEAAGDFELATTGPGFTVEDRQVPDTPAWPNAAITQAAGARVGTSDVAVCTAPTRLMINNRQVPLADGGHLNLPGGSKVSLTGNTYLIQDATGDSLTAAVNTGTPNWIDTSVGLARWPETVHGLLANAGTNPNALQARNGTVLTAPFNFSQFYNTYGNSWRIPATQSLLSACGTKVATGNPTNVLYTGNLPPKVAITARAACVAAGVTAAPLLDACTVDTAVLGTSAIAAYQGLPANLTWGKITPPAANTHTPPG